MTTHSTEGSRSYYVRLTDSIASAATAKSQERGQTFSEYVRNLIAADLGVELPTMAGRGRPATGQKRYQRKGRTPRPCAICGQPFKAKRLDARICSEKCKWKAFKSLQNLRQS